MRYHRPEEIHKGRLIESRVENIIVFLPDIAAACMPSSLEWEETISMYKQACAEEIAEELNEDNISVHIYSLIYFLFLLYFSFLRPRQQFHHQFLDSLIYLSDLYLLFFKIIWTLNKACLFFHGLF